MPSPIERAAELGLAGPTPAERRESWRRFEAGVVARVLPLLSDGDAAQVRAIFAAFFASPANFDWQPVLTHADIDDHNLLADPASGELTGVIDWGDIRVGDPAGDFTSVLYGALGDAGLRAQLPSILEACGLTLAELDTMRPRCRFHEFTWPLHDIFYGLDSHNDAIVRRGVDSLRVAIRTYSR